MAVRERKRGLELRLYRWANIKGLIGIKMMDKGPNARIKELCGVTKDVDERIDEGVLQWFDHVKITENDKIA